MIDKEKLMKTWDNLKDETKIKILELADKEIKEDYIVTKEGEEYYYYDYSYESGGINFVDRVFHNSNLDIFNIETGNVFRTSKEATFAGQCDYFTKRFKTCVNRHTKELDWNNEEQYKYYAYYSYEDKYVQLMSSTTNRTQGTVYASSIQILKDIIADIGEDNFEKYVMKVME